MQHAVDEELMEVFRAIVADGRTPEEWSETESCDEFQTERYCGGFDALEQAFTFSFYAPDGEEWWFQLTIDEVREIVAGARTSVEMRPAET